MDGFLIVRTCASPLSGVILTRMDAQEKHLRSAEPQVAIASRGPSLPRWISAILEKLTVPGEFETASGEVFSFGPGAPQFRVKFRRDSLLRIPQDELSLGRAYVNGELDLEGDMLALLEALSQLSDRFRLWNAIRQFAERWLVPVKSLNRQVINRHYTLGNDFYFSFLDTRYRFYSHCLFHHDDEELEQAAEHKLETTFNELRLQPGMRLLDIGDGWGGTFQYCCPRGIRMTGITLFENSSKFVSDLIRRDHLEGSISLQDFLAFRPQEPFDAIVMYGVIEHITDYTRFFARVRECLKPGGRIYLDGAASKTKYEMSQFTREYTWQGAHSFMYLPELTQRALERGFAVEEVKEETRDYELTMLHWARRLDENREKIVSGWGEETYRSFRLFLWGGCHAFKTDRLQAYHMLARRQ
jgi:cyclopropane-fatty-acyl-phospholipid synthase